MRCASPFVLSLVATCAACQRAPPAGAGELERPVFDLPGPPQPADYWLAPRAGPGLAVAAGLDDLALGDGPTCTVTAWNNGVVHWRRALPECRGRFELAWTPGSMLLVRAEHLLVAVRSDGAEAWRLSLDDASVPDGARGLAALADSQAVLAESPTSVLGVTQDGREGWRYVLSADEPLVAAPRAGPTEGAVLLTAQAATFLHSDGSLRARVPLRP